MVSPALVTHFERVKTRYLSATLTNLPSGAALISVPSCGLPTGWPVQEVTLRFIAPNGYPMAAPDCFWVEPNLSLASGALPKSSNINNKIPETDIAGHWFSWHVGQGHWSANQHDLITWINLCLKRLQTIE